MKPPELKSCFVMKRDDFDRHPVWVCSFHVDRYEQWWTEMDSEPDFDMFRPWLGPTPVDGSTGLYIVRGSALFNDGSEHAAVIGGTMPGLIWGPNIFSFWTGPQRISPEEKEAFYRAVDRTSEEVFPVIFSADTSLATGIEDCRAEGFTWIDYNQLRVQR